jgi:hypothetical protein
MTMSGGQITLKLGRARNITIMLHQGLLRRDHSLCTPNKLVTRVKIAIATEVV